MKARLKKLIISTIGVMSVFSVFTFTSCESDKCKTIVCAYEGNICTEGQCICASGYEGPQCETISRKKFLGTWVVTEVGSVSDASTYSTTIQTGVSLHEIKIENLWNFIETDVSAFVRKDTLIIPQQEIEGYTIVGEGYVEDDKYYGDNGR